MERSGRRRVRDPLTTKSRTSANSQGGAAFNRRSGEGLPHRRRSRSRGTSHCRSRPSRHPPLPGRLRLRGGGAQEVGRAGRPLCRRRVRSGVRGSAASARDPRAPMKPRNRGRRPIHRHPPVFIPSSPMFCSRTTRSPSSRSTQVASSRQRLARRSLAKNDAARN